MTVTLHERERSSLTTAYLANPQFNDLNLHKLIEE